jgi:hypothetical protein
LEEKEVVEVELCSIELELCTIILDIIRMEKEEEEEEEEVHLPACAEAFEGM